MISCQIGLVGQPFSQIHYSYTSETSVSQRINLTHTHTHKINFKRHTNAYITINLCIFKPYVPCPDLLK
uniref:Uncharacterized protein n=1 Tax=Anguilla anguilla TaxID=7936 RepID=A0A0E9WYI2_ANGAN